MPTDSPLTFRENRLPIHELSEKNAVRRRMPAPFKTRNRPVGAAGRGAFVAVGTTISRDLTVSLPRRQRHCPDSAFVTRWGINGNTPPFRHKFRTPTPQMNQYELDLS